MSETRSGQRRIVEELCAVLGHPDKVEALLGGAPMKVDAYSVRLISEAADPGHLFVYADLGVPADPAHAYERMLKVNFELAAGQHGVLSLHPKNGHALYAFRYPLAASSSGKDLVDRLLRFLTGTSVTELSPPGGQPRKS